LKVTLSSSSFWVILFRSSTIFVVLKLSVLDYFVSGVYPVGPPVPAVGGNEGVGEVIAVGDGVEKLAVNDWVIPAMAGLGKCSISLYS
jgi:hypothetical protein